MAVQYLVEILNTPIGEVTVDRRRAQSYDAKSGKIEVPNKLGVPPPAMAMLLAFRTKNWRHGEVVGFFKHTLALCGGIFAVEVHHVLAEEDVVVVLATVKAERNGRSAAFPEVHVWRLVNAKVTEFREFQGDEQTEDRFWS